MFTGTYVINSYSVLIFEETGTSIDPFTASIVLSIIQIFGCLCSTQFSDRLGRKISLSLSLIGSAIGSLSLIFYLEFVDYGFDLSVYAWLPVLSLSFIIFVSSAGINPLLSVCTVENLPTKVMRFFFIFNLVNYSNNAHCNFTHCRFTWLFFKFLFFSCAVLVYHYARLLKILVYLYY